MRWPGENLKGMEASMVEREGQMMFDREAKTTIQLLEALRQHVARGARCDVALFEDLRAVRNEVEAISDRAEKLLYNASYGLAQGKMPNIYRRGASSSTRKRPRQRQVAGSQRSQFQSQQASMLDPSLRSGTSCSDRVSAAAPVPWFDLVRPVPDVSMKELCRPQTSLDEILDGGESRAVTPGPHPRSPPPSAAAGRARRVRPQPPRPATCTPTPTGRRPPSRRSPPASDDTPKAMPQRPASSLAAVSSTKRGEEAVATQAQQAAEVQEPEAAAPSAEDLAFLETLSGEIHIRATVEFEPGGESPIMPEHIDFQVAETSSAAKLDVWPASLLVPPAGGDIGGVVLEVGHAGRGELRVLIAGPGGQESTRVPLARVVESAGGSGKAVPLEWEVDEWCTVHLSAALFLEEAASDTPVGASASASASSADVGISALGGSAAAGPPAPPREPAKGAKAHEKADAPSATASLRAASAAAPAMPTTSNDATQVPRAPTSNRDEPGRRPRPVSTTAASATAAGSNYSRAGFFEAAEEAEAVSAYVRRMLLRGSSQLMRRAHAARQAAVSANGPPTPVRSRPQSGNRSRPQSAGRPRSAGMGRAGMML
mmetsp:Transcript_161372/g.286142  ORF Transcript_161372/g.286142 Transcript_161372/m.286142 type:complete len:600 (-) Transcript_161372:95-1894(-)